MKSLIFYLSPMLSIFFLVIMHTPSVANDPKSDFQGIASQICAGKANPDFLSYKSASGHHPVTLVTNEGILHKYHSLLPNEWVTKDLMSTEIVACIEKEKEEIQETCPYKSSFFRGKTFTINRIRYRQLIILRSTQTGNEISRRNFGGSIPRNCKFSEPENIRKIIGKRVRFPDIKSWIEDFVNGYLP